MTYLQRLRTSFQNREDCGLTAVDLFAGCGGLSLGFEAAGFSVTGFEADPSACLTCRRNLQGECRQEELTVESALPLCDVLIGGPPCQPFSALGNQLGQLDSRDGLKIFRSAVLRLRPRLWLFENVRGLLQRHGSYLEEILSPLRGAGYEVGCRLINAVDFGVPQNRVRLVVVGHYGGYSWPESETARIACRNAVGRLVSRIPADSRFLTPSMERYVRRYEKASCCAVPRDLRMDRPARTLTCRNLYGATGDMLRVRLPDGRRRMLTIREAARLQSFPDWYAFDGSPAARMTQIGNAVPPLVALAFARSIRRFLLSSS